MYNLRSPFDASKAKCPALTSCVHASSFGWQCERLASNHADSSTLGFVLSLSLSFTFLVCHLVAARGNSIFCLVYCSKDDMDCVLLLNSISPGRWCSIKLAYLRTWRAVDVQWTGSDEQQ
jgi:hypothetical protein